MRHLIKVVTVVAVLAIASAFAVPTAGAASKAHVCISVNGTTVVKTGTANCFSTPGNRAHATGAGSFASASGEGSVARARKGGTAIAFDSDQGFALATGSDSLASTTRGTGQRAVASGGGSAVLIDCVNESLSSTDGSALFKAC